MDLKNLFTDEDAVSPVIGVILMVAITVILAAVIGAFVLNIGGNQETAPQAQLEADFNPDNGNGFETAVPNDGTDEVTISHGGGGTFDATQLSATLNGTTVDNLITSGSPNIIANSGWSTSTSAGDSITFAENNSTSPETYFKSGDEITIAWTSSSGENSQIIFETTFP